MHNYRNLQGELFAFYSEQDVIALKTQLHAQGLCTVAYRSKDNCLHLVAYRRLSSRLIKLDGSLRYVGANDLVQTLLRNMFDDYDRPASFLGCGLSCTHSKRK